ncbi:MAG TPA: hypothetical protein VGO62_12565, partial [Myxococcota bacterium]
MKHASSLAALVVVVVALVSACPKPAGTVDAGMKPVAHNGDAGPLTPPGSKRPPYPNMATPAWGQHILDERLAKVPSEGPAASQKTVLDELHDLSPGSEQHAAELAAQWYKNATKNSDKGEAVALLGVALVLDPTVEGYKDRLTDAVGLAHYAGGLDSSSSLSQAARVVIGASAGMVPNAKALLDVVETTPGLGTEPRYFMALGQKLTGGKLDSVLDDAEKALAARPTSMRVHSLLAELYLDTGLYPETIKACGSEDDAHPWLAAVRGRALVLDGKVDDGIALLKKVQDKVDEGRRGDVLYWLARSLTQKEGADAEVQTIASTLEARPGYAKEAAVLNALLAQKAGDYKKARGLVEKIVRGPPNLPVDIDATWLLVDACGGDGDVLCVDRAGARAVSADGDYARLNLARAA